MVVEVQRRWLLRSSGDSGAYWDRELAVEVQQCPLRSRAGEEARRRGGEEEEMIKSNNPHLAGGEQKHLLIYYLTYWQNWNSIFPQYQAKNYVKLDVRSFSESD